MGLARKLGGVPAATELRDAYLATPLYHADSRSDNNLLKYQEAVAYIAKTFNPSKIGISYESWRDAKVRWVADCQRLFPSDSAKEVERLAGLHWAMTHSKAKDRKSLLPGTTEFSHAQAQVALRQMFGGENDRHITTRLFRKLQVAGLIEKRGTYLTGVRGQPWVVKSLEASK